MNKSVIVFGPSGCGKTTHARALARHFGLNRIVDGHEALPANGALERTDTLYLVQQRPPFSDACDPYDRRCLAFHDAMRLADLPARGTHP